jgi:hypothetical protein
MNPKQPITTKVDLAAKMATLPAPVAPLPQNTALANLGLDAADLALMGGGMDSGDISIPRMVILQSTSPEISDALGTPGDFFIKGINQNLGKGPLEIIPLLRSKSRIRWKPIDEGGGLLCRSIDGKTGQGDPGGNCDTCTKKEWIHKDPKSGKLKPDCDLYENIICVLRGQEDWIPVAFSGSRTRLKAIKDLNTLLMFELNKGRPLFSKCYTVKGMKKTGTVGNTYFTFGVSTGNNNQVLPQEEIVKAAAIFNSIKGKKLVVSEDREEEDAGGHEGPAL